MVEQLLGRKGAARIALIPADVLEALNEGQVPTVNLNEFLALDLGRLTRNVARHIGLPPDADRITDTLAMLGAFRPVKRHEHVARALYDLAAAAPDRDAIAHRLATHPSDVARGWATQWIMFSRHAAARQAAIGAPFRGRSAFRRARDGLDGGARRSARGGWTRPWACWSPGCTTATKTSGVLRAN